MMDDEQVFHSERPSEDPDYQRLTDVTLAIETEIVKVGPMEVLNRRFDYDMAFQYGIRRTEETSQRVKLENPDYVTLVRLLSAAWPEGFIFGALAYTQERRGRKAEAFLDRIALANINQTLARASETERSLIFSRVISMQSLAYVDGVRSMRAVRILQEQAVRILQEQAPVASHEAIKATVVGHWLDGFLVGMVFEELGGHRESEPTG